MLWRFGKRPRRQQTYAERIRYAVAAEYETSDGPKYLDVAFPIRSGYKG